MSLVRTSLLNGIAVAVKVGVAVVLNKILAVYVGPGGYAAIGQFQNAIAVALSVAGGIIGPGVTKATAEHFDDAALQRATWQTAVKLSLAGTLIASMTCLLAAPWLSASLLHSTAMTQVFVGLGLALPAIASNNLLLAIINGKKEIGAYVLSNIVGSLLSLLIVGVLTYLWGLNGALLAVAISPAALLFVTVALILNRPWFHKSSFWGSGSPSILRQLCGFGLMGLTSAITAPLSYMFIRDYLSGTLGQNAAGYWQASWKISEVYLMLVTLTLSVYYLPRLAEIRMASELKAEIGKVYTYVMPIVILSASTMYLMRDFIVRILFSPDFAPMRDLFFWQLAGDILKIGAWILSYVMLGRSMVRSFVATEVLFTLSFYFLTTEFVPHYGLQGVSMAYALSYALYWLAMVFLIRTVMRTMASNHNNLKM